MKRIKRRLLSVVLVLTMLIGLGIPVNVVEAAETVEINLLGTSDLHGFLRAHDYATDTATTYGLTKVASIVKEERNKDKDLLLVDCGDATQGNFVSDFRGDAIHPVVNAMNLLKYDAFVLGNHEFNYEFSSLTKIIDKSQASILGGNIYKTDGTRFVKPYIIKEVKGVKVAMFGITAPHVTRWESDAGHYNNMTFTTPMEETDKILKELEGKADVIIGIYHYGEEGEYDTEGMYEVAKKYSDKVDAFLIGHSHSMLEKYLVNGEFTDEYSTVSSTVLLSTGSQGRNVGKMTISLEKSGTNWEIKDRKVDNISTEKYNEDEELVKALELVHNASVKTANMVVGKIGENFYENPFLLPGIPYAVIQDGPLIDLINKVQMEVTKADVSLAALFDVNSNLQKGDYKKKDGVKVYKYDNTLIAVKITGKELKAIMEEQAGKFFNQYMDGDVTISFNEKIRLYNFDMFAGVDYQIDISKPVGQRIVNLMYHGAPLKDEEKLVLALNNYRYGGLSASGFISKDPENIVYNSAATSAVPAVRDMISEYVAKLGELLPTCDNNWKIIGYNFDYVGTEKVYEMLRNGKITIPASTDGRTSNISAINMNELAKQGITTLDEAKRVEIIAEPVVAEVKETKDDPEINNDVPEVSNDVPEVSKEYSIVKGDCLSKIAKKFQCTVAELLKLNPKIKNPDLIYVGQVILISE